MFSDVNCMAAADINTLTPITNCLTGQIFAGEILLAGIFLILVIGFLLWKSKLNISSTVPILTVLAFALSNINQIFNVLWLIAIVANAVLVVVGIFTYAKKS